MCGAMHAAHCRPVCTRRRPALGQVILDQSRSNYAQLLAAQTLLKLVNENTLT